MQFPASYGSYTLLARLGEGGMAEVFLARKSGPGPFSKLLVIKRILPSLEGETELLQLFLDEARVAARFEHPNVVQIYDFGEVEGSSFLAMEYLAGQSVADLEKETVKAGIKVPYPFSARILAEACEGLSYVHGLNVVHRDVSPQNLFVTYEGRVKLLDFGLAKAASALSNTRPGVVKGRLSYMAPEQCRGESIDGRADVFALGVVLTELISGRRMFESDSEHALLRKLSSGDFKKPSELNLDVPAPLLEVCDRAMAFRKEDRYADCAGMKSDLERWLQSGPPSGAEQVSKLMGQLFKEDIVRRQQVLRAAEAGRPEPKPKGRRNPAVLVAVALTALLGAGFGVAMRLWPKRAPNAPAKILVHSTPDGCALLVNGRAQGTTPTTVVVNAPADLTVEVQCAGYRPQSKQVRAGPGESVTVELAPAAP